MPAKSSMPLSPILSNITHKWPHPYRCAFTGTVIVLGVSVTLWLTCWTVFMPVRFYLFYIPVTLTGSSSMSWSKTLESILFSAYLILLDRRHSYNSSEISSNIYLLYRNQLILHLPPNKCLRLLLRRYGTVHLFIRLSVPTRREIKQDVSTHQLSRIHETQWVPTTTRNALVLCYTHRKLKHTTKNAKLLTLSTFIIIVNTLILIYTRSIQ